MPPVFNQSSINNIDPKHSFLKFAFLKKFHIHILLILVLLVGLMVTSYVAQQKTKLYPKAADQASNILSKIVTKTPYVINTGTDGCGKLWDPVPPAAIITSSDGNVTVGVNKKYGGAIVYYADKRIPQDAQINYSGIMAKETIIDYSNAGTLFTTAIWTLPIDNNETTYCTSGSSDPPCGTIPFNNPTQGGFSGCGWYGNPNPASVVVNDNKITAEYRFVNYNWAYPSVPPLTDYRLQTNFWGKSEISFHPIFPDILILDQTITYCKDMHATCASKPVTLQDSQLSSLFGAGQSPYQGQPFRGPYTRAAFRSLSGNKFIDFTAGPSQPLGVDPKYNLASLSPDYQSLGYRTENWGAVLHKSQNFGIGYSVLNYEPVPKDSFGNIFGYRSTFWPSLIAHEPEINKFERSNVNRISSVVINGTTYTGIRYTMQPGGWYKFRTYVSTGKLTDGDGLDIRWKLIKAADSNFNSPLPYPHRPQIDGFVDIFSCNQIAGWVRDSEIPDKDVTVRAEIYPLNNPIEKIVRVTKANLDRTDLDPYCTDGTCAFNITLDKFPETFANKKIRLDVYGESPSGVKYGQNRIYYTASNLVGPCSNISQASPTPTPSPSPSPTPTLSPCNFPCTWDGSCQTGLTCEMIIGKGNVCRNPSCVSETDCTCVGTTPSPTPSPSPSVAPSPCAAPLALAKTLFCNSGKKLDITWTWAPVAGATQYQFQLWQATVYPLKPLPKTLLLNKYITTTSTVTNDLDSAISYTARVMVNATSSTTCQAPGSWSGYVSASLKCN